MCEIELLLLREAVATTVQQLATVPMVSRPGEMLDGETTPSSGRYRGEMQWLWWREGARRGSVEVTSMISVDAAKEEYRCCDWRGLRWSWESCVFGRSSCNLVNSHRPFSSCCIVKLFHAPLPLPSFLILL
jgi:hypothetical protein